jgi:Trk K+ transport system NAD-binding subunit
MAFKSFVANYNNDMAIQKVIQSDLFYVNPYSRIVKHKVENLCKQYGIIFLDIDSRSQARINRPDYIIYGDERMSVEGSEENVSRFICDATKPKENLEKIIGRNS